MAPFDDVAAGILETDIECRTSHISPSSSFSDNESEIAPYTSIYKAFNSYRIVSVYKEMYRYVMPDHLNVDK